ncbi:MAG: FAD-dependent oxidoreductase [Cyanobacteria bacterium P01_F01_bin.150]
MTRRNFMLGAGAAVGAGLVPWPSHAQPENGPQLKGYLRTNWSRDPFAYGTYSHIAKGARRRDHWHLAQPLMDRLFFAGEAANPDRNSSVHAALETGRSVAHRAGTSADSINQSSPPLLTTSRAITTIGLIYMLCLVNHFY